MQTTTMQQLVIDRIKSECRPVDVEERFANWLDELYGNERFFQDQNLYPSNVLKGCDPIAFTQGVNDYVGNDENLIELDGDYYSRGDVEDVKQTVISEVENSIG